MVRLFRSPGDISAAPDRASRSCQADGPDLLPLSRHAAAFPLRARTSTSRHQASSLSESCQPSTRHLAGALQPRIDREARQIPMRKPDTRVENSSPAPNHGPRSARSRGCLVGASHHRKATGRRGGRSSHGAYLPLEAGFRSGPSVGVVAMEIKPWTSERMESPTVSTGTQLPRQPLARRPLANRSRPERYGSRRQLDRASQPRRAEPGRRPVAG